MTDLPITARRRRARNTWPWIAACLFALAIGLAIVLVRLWT